MLRSAKSSAEGADEELVEKKIIHLCWTQSHEIVLSKHIELELIIKFSSNVELEEEQTQTGDGGLFRSQLAGSLVHNCDFEFGYDVSLCGRSVVPERSSFCELVERHRKRGPRQRVL